MQNTIKDKIGDAIAAEFHARGRVIGHDVTKKAAQRVLDTLPLLILDKDAEPEDNDVGIDKRGTLCRYSASSETEIIDDKWIRMGAKTDCWLSVVGLVNIELPVKIIMRQGKVCIQEGE